MRAQTVIKTLFYLGLSISFSQRTRSMSNASHDKWLPMGDQVPVKLKSMLLIQLEACCGRPFYKYNILAASSNSTQNLFKLIIKKKSGVLLQQSTLDELNMGCTAVQSSQKLNEELFQLLYSGIHGIIFFHHIFFVSGLLRKMRQFNSLKNFLCFLWSANTIHNRLSYPGTILSLSAQ